MLDALYRLSEGQPLPADLAARAQADRRHFLRRSCLGYVVVDTFRASPALRRFAIETLDLVPRAQAEGRELLVPASRSPGEPCAAHGRRAWGPFRF